jgi:hypothetical protein
MGGNSEASHFLPLFSWTGYRSKYSFINNAKGVKLDISK